MSVGDRFGSRTDRRRRTVHVSVQYRGGLSATYDYSPGECDPLLGGEEETCTAFLSEVYVSYETRPTALARVGSIELRGINEWGWFFANSFNEYAQRIEQAGFTGADEGGIQVRGELQAGRGSCD